MNGWTEGMDMDEWMDGQKGLTWMDEWMDGLKNGWMDGQTGGPDRWMSPVCNCKCCIFLVITGLKCSSVPEEERHTRAIRGLSDLLCADTSLQAVHINSGTWNMVLSLLWTSKLLLSS